MMSLSVMISRCVDYVVFQKRASYFVCLFLFTVMTL